MSAELTQENTPRTTLVEDAPQNDFDALLNDEISDVVKALSPRSAEREAAAKNAVQLLVEQALESTQLIPGDSVRTIEAMIAEIDKKLSEQVNLIIHQPEFQQLEGTWRGLHHLVFNTETDEMLKIRVMNLSKADLGKSLKRYPGAMWDQSPLFKKIYEEEFGTPNGSPYGCLIGDYHFDHTAPDVAALTGMSKIAAAAFAPFIAAASPNLLNMGSWQELSNPRDLTKIFGTAEYTEWRALRASEDSRFLGLTMPRYLARLPYGAKNNPVEEFAFEEDAEGGDHSKYVWSNSAYAMATNITRAFKLYGWCARIRGAESGGMVEGLPCHTFPTDDGGVDMKCPTEIAITDRRENELATNGLMPLSHWKNTNYAVFVGANSVQKPAEYYDANDTANAKLSSRLPYMFATCRFAHYLKAMVRDKIGSYKERGDMEDWLNSWIAKYVVLDPRAGEEIKAQYPLAEARVEVQEIPGNPGFYSSKFFLRPHYQLEGLTVSLRLVSRLPAAAKGS